MNQGKVVEYIEAGAIVSAVCLLDEGNKLHLLTPSNREVNLPPKRALLISDTTLSTHTTREEILTRLKEIIARRTRLQELVAVQELWDLVRDENEVFGFKYLAELSFGKDATEDHISALVRAVFDDKLHFKLKDGHFVPNSETKIELVLREQEQAAQKEKWLQEGSRWLRQVLEGKPAEEPSCKAQVVDILVELALFREDSPDHKFGKELLSRAGVNDLGEVRGLLVKLGVWEEDENLDLLRLKVRTCFTASEVEECERIAGTPIDVSGREDLRDLDIFTIDGPLTEDFDDALSLEIRDDLLHVGVHISDVAALIPIGSDLDRCAEAKGTSLYLARRLIPMLPPALSHGALSLKQGLDRPAISMLGTFDREGNLIDSRFTLSLVCVKRRLEYDAVNEVYQKDELFSELHRLSMILRRKRVENGAMLLPLPEVYVEIGEDGMLSIKLSSQETPSKIIVSEFMVLYNWLAARYCRDRRIPSLYRAQATPSEIVNLPEADPLYAVLKQRGKLSPLEIDTKPRPHSGIGLDVYTNVTSPIRRYFDLVAQRQIRGALLGMDPPYTTDDLDKMRHGVDPLLRDLGRMKRNRLRYWILKYLTQQVGKTLEARVMSIFKSKYRIVLTDFLLMTEMKRQEGQSLPEGQAIRVRVKKVNPWEDILQLEQVGK